MTREEIVKRIKEEVLEDLNPDSWVRNRLENIFPELVESEDERIRNILIDLIKCNEKSGHDSINNVPTSSLIAWLKSLKDRVQPQQKQDWSEDDELHLTNAIFVAEKEWGTDSHTANWLKSLKDRVQPQNLTITDEELSQAKKNAYNDTLDKIEYHSGEPTFDDGWDAAIWYLKKRNIQPQLKQEWNEEDKKMLNDILMCGERHCYLDAGNIAWLKSLKERVQLQQKQEWSEEDEKIINFLRKCVQQPMGTDFLGDIRKTDVLAWLENKKTNKRSGQWDVSNFRTWQYIVCDVLTKKDGIGQYLDNGECKKIAKYMQEEWSKKLS